MDSWRASRTIAAQSRAGIVAALADARAGRLHAPAAGEHARRILFGFTAPFTILRLAWRDPGARRSIVDRMILPVVFMAIALAAGIGSIAKDLLESRGNVAVLAADADDDDDDDERNPAVDRAARNAALQAVREHRPPAALVASTMTAATDAQQRTKPTHASFGAVLLRFLESKLGGILVALGVLEWVLVWIVREHHDVVAGEAARVTGVPAEQLAGPPRLRFDFGWLWLKAWRALRFVLFVVAGSPPAWVLGAIPHAGPYLAGAWEGAWAAYWGCVFAIANTFLAWDAPPAPDAAPWFVRALRRAGRVPVVGLLVRPYAALLAWMTRPVWPACLAFEEAPWEAMGLALARLVAGIPVLYLVCRPMFPPAASHALVARRGPSPTPMPAPAPAPAR